MKNIVYSVASALLLVGCSSHPVDPIINMKPPAYVEQMPTRVNENISSNPGSLFGQGDNPLFSDLKAMHVNDVVTVTITETTAQTSSAKKALAKDSSSGLGAGVTTSGGGGLVNTVAKNVNDVGNIGFTAGSTSSFAGTGSNTRNESFNTTISARIIKILSNGNYFIEGSRELLINGEKQIVQLSGVIRPYDIDNTNTISSKYISDAKILYKTEGDIDQSTTRPWGSKFMESVWPF